MSGQGKLKNIVLCGGVEEAAYLQISDKIRESNRLTLVIFSIVAFIIFGSLSSMSFFTDSLVPYRAIYVSSFILSIVIWFIAKFPGKESKAAVTVDIYLFSLMLILSGIFIGTVMSPTELAASYIAMLLAAPQAFTDRPWRMYLFIGASVVFFIIMALHFKDPSAVSSDITNAVVFGLVSIVLFTYSAITRIKRYSLEYQIRFLAENDQLTGLKNRYSYQMFVDNSGLLNSSSIYCIYVDVNGLHELNNSKGHEAGDLMLQYVGSVMQHLFGKDNAYRIGGDEFVALGVDKSVEEITELVAQMKTAVESAGYHIAAGIGVREKKEIELSSIIKEAEQEMYKDKSAFYQSTENDRRRS